MKHSKSIFVKILFCIILIAASLVATMLLSGLVFPNDEQSIKMLISSGKSITAEGKIQLLMMKIAQGIQTAGIFLVPSFIVLTFFYRLKGFMLPLTSKIKGRDIFDVVFLIFFTNTIIYVVAHFCQLFPWPQAWMQDNETSQKLSNLLVMGASYSDLAVNLVVVCLLPAVCEELFFRGMEQRLLMKWLKDPHVNIFIAAVLFSAFHFDPVMFIPRFLLGAILGYLFYWSGSLILPMIAHFVNNALYVIGAFIISKVQNNPMPQGSSDEINVDNFNLLLSIVLVALLLSFIYRRHMSVKEYIRIEI